DQVELEQLAFDVQDRILSTTASPGTTGYTMIRSPGQTTPRSMPRTRTRDFPDSVLTPDLRDTVATGTNHVYLQSTTLPSGAPGLVAGSVVDVPTAGQHELYLVYDLTDANST